MSYDTLVDEVRALPESCLEDVAKYIRFLQYQYEQEQMAPLMETDSVFEEKLEQGYRDAMEGRTRPLDEAFQEIKARFG